MWNKARASSRKLLCRVAFQEDRLLQNAEELLVGHGVLNGPKVKLSAGSYDELRIVASANRNGNPHKVAAVIERAPGAVVSSQEEEGVRTVEQVGGIDERRLLDRDVFFGGHDPQLLVEHLNFAVEVLQGQDDRLEHFPSIRCLKYPCLRGSDLDLALLGQPNLRPGVGLIFMPHFVG